jgi:hypothetical protein
LFTEIKWQNGYRLRGKKGPVAKLEIDRWHDAALFIYFTTGIFLFFITFIQFIHRWSAQLGNPPWGAEPGIELGPALQHADALPSELRRTLK